MTVSDSHRTIDAIWRFESAKLIAGLTRIVRDVGLAEDLAQDALVIALERWPEVGIPDNPGAWLMTTAKRRAMDQFRRNKLQEHKYEELGHSMELYHEPDFDADLDSDVGDDLLRLIFTTCHPVLSPEARVALTLRLLGGLTTDEIAHAFLIPEPTVAQRIVRAKRTLAAARVPFEVPEKSEHAARLSSVLQVIYLMFNELRLPVGTGLGLCSAKRLSVLAVYWQELFPWNRRYTVSLRSWKFKRLGSRPGLNLLGSPYSSWTRIGHIGIILIHRGLASLDRAERFGSALGPYSLQAAIAACHARSTNCR